MTQLPLGLYGRLNFFIFPVPLPGQLALAPETDAAVGAKGHEFDAKEPALLYIYI
jgi:hypothetical protein